MYRAQIAPRPFAKLLKPQPLSDIGKAGKGLSGQLPYLVQPGAQVLNVGGVDAPGLIGPFRILVQVGAAPLEQDGERGGTKNTLDYAQRTGVPCVVIRDENCSCKLGRV